MPIDAVADPDHGGLDEVGGRRGLDAGDALDEVAQDVLAPRCVGDLGVELDAVQMSLRRLEPGERRGIRLGRGDEAFRQSRDRVAMTHPDRLFALESTEQAIIDVELHACRPVLALSVASTSPPGSRHQLGAIADAEDRDPPGPDSRVGLGASSSYTEEDRRTG